MEVTRDVILDLLPLYLADEVSLDTRALVEAYLETDPEMAKLAEQSLEAELAKDIRIPFTTEDKMKAYLQAKRLIFWRNVILTVLGVFTLFGLLAMAMLAFRLFGA